ncbi:type IV toxin-antitoxin system AbiEi family antitoxin domain-containing protein [Rathayibacter sp. AY1E2]|uniref:type IV toxin-antitoxin system AbiEi family antitoxin domain-containing protein n=1 Tax=Rathayibacter sp. AY1E2 TaxID=2080550 RepID=UPI000CE863B7|nr:type IV toxin-antitoxin system AbiEi family antitoxin domain-containing protein [Rathayibacter sp. AY1E2]PPH53123.1 transcriptional regulator [Rathayibacter sp. AY1E2]
MSTPVALAALAAVSAGQWGMLTTAQAAAVSVSRVQLTRLTQQGHLERLVHGVYRDAGSASGEFDDVRAAWLSTDPKRTAAERVASQQPGAVVGGNTAAYLHGFGDLQPDPYEFATPIRRQSKRLDIRYRHRPLTPGDVTVRAGLPTTTIDRTIADLLSDHEDVSLVAAVLADAVRHSAVDLERLTTLLEPLAARHGYLKNDGAGLLQRLLEAGGVDTAAQLRRLNQSEAWRESVGASAGNALVAAISAQVAETLSHNLLNVRTQLAEVLRSVELNRIGVDALNFTPADFLKDLHPTLELQRTVQDALSTIDFSASVREALRNFTPPVITFSNPLLTTTSLAQLQQTVSTLRQVEATNRKDPSPDERTS